ncbi:LysR substrate-binding domain-containing protein [Psychrobium sp. 1_MG-2023]|uniref:LysR substrate-binding domain-containing protein n=1 Tax=Psychrobium sp. 1_MG-2023 TaxID=3062624 RepID=UPI000C332E36|nr:LysR substrate-binding domain-containing protein [Psychrobium sp. 1_MG-2023]MDP2561358.1 LysR substrate-binding domain-containing protein [Psychrobium sp. 1_MG-2023]PKF54839.1 LysR family transcriptional regulator [Alteromonadales bacterium alter-6D02]
MVSPITLDALKVLDAIERKKSFAAAADELFKVPSAISYTVNKLEDDLGVAIFDRSKRKAELTAIGQTLVEQGREILKATDELTHMAKQSANGWELELRICIDSILLFEPIYRLIAEFQQLHPWINIKVTEEVFGGTWDALNADNCDLVIGATGEPYSKGFSIVGLGQTDFVFTVSKNHPLTQAPQPLSNESIKAFPSVVVADSSRNLPARSVGLLDGQSRLTVPSVEKKIEAHLLGLGVGSLPLHRIKTLLASGELVVLTLAESESRLTNVSMAWRKGNEGKALAWFVDKVQEMKGELL